MEEPKDRRLIALAVFAAIAVLAVAGVLIGRSGGGGSSDTTAHASPADCKKVPAPQPKSVKYSAPPQTVKPGEKLTATMETSRPRASAAWPAL